MEELLDRSQPASVALETTLLAHGVPPDAAAPLAHDLSRIIAAEGAHAATCGLVAGRPIVGMHDDELARLLAADAVKTNTATLGLAIANGRTAATTVSTTMELAASAGVRVFATGGLGGVHRGFGHALDVSADLAAFTRFPVAVVCSGVKSILDVESTREALETLGIPVVGWRCDQFPAFYSRSSDASVDERFDDLPRLAAFAAFELQRTGRGIVVCNPIPEADEIDTRTFDAWRAEAESRASAQGAVGRGVTPAVLGALHEISAGRTLAANLALVRNNAKLAAQLAVSLAGG